MLRRTRVWLAAAALCLLAACSGGRTGSGPPTPSQPTLPPTSAEAARFLTQATFGATDTSVTSVKNGGYANWVNDQIALPVSATHLAFVDSRLVALKAANSAATLGPTEFYESFWQQAIEGPDQLRQRVKFALSEIFVISLNDGNITARGAASYYDMLGANAFGNYRTILEQVTLHPMMGIYLTWMANQKEDPVTGRNPDENYAREVMQLMSIGLYQLNSDGTVKVDSGGKPIPAYTAEDISGLAKVFTGYAWYSPNPTATTFRGSSKDPNADVRAMIPYAAFHSQSAKTFLGTTIPASATANPAGDLKIALDVLFNHPNTAPFISKQMIQRLVTSNPSPAYVARVSAAFTNNGAGVRGDMAAVVRAVLLDPEARNTTAAIADPNYGKLREPVIRMANWMRAFNAQSASGAWLLGSTSANTSLSQTAMASPSVFNFFRPGYSPSSTKLGNLGYVAPEFQVVDEVTTAGYLNTMQSAIGNGVGSAADIKSAYTAEIAIAADAPALVERMNILLLNGQMSPTLRTRITEAVTGVAIPAATAGQAAVTTALTNRAKLAAFMAMASSEYLTQR